MTDATREALEQCLGCVQAAESEGLHELIVELRGSNGSVDRLIDLIDRRLLWVREYAAPALAAPPPALELTPVAWAEKYLEEDSQVPCTKFYWDKPTRNRSTTEIIPLYAAHQATLEPDWQDDPSSDERWNAGVDFVMIQLCNFMGIDPHMVTWDAAT